MTEKIAPQALHLATVEKAAEIFADAGMTPSAIRATIFKREDRFNSRGEKIPGNGLAASGALLRRGRKIVRLRGVPPCVVMVGAEDGCSE